MRKGLHNLIFGLILIFMQIIVYVYGGVELESTENATWNFGSFIGYNVYGILGLILLIFYFRKNRTKKK